MGQSASKNQ
jgi:hypothetical protein